MSNVTGSILSNPLFGVVVALFILLIALSIVRMFQPSFSMGAELSGHFGTLDGKLKLEAYDNEHFTNCHSDHNNCREDCRESDGSCSC